jgi:Leishmanolysin/Bacterial pre-peptidase C-terminal domain
MFTERRRRSRRRNGNLKLNGSRRLCMETLEPRLALTWGGVPPTSITPPSNAAAVTLVSNDATGSASIATTEVDYYSFTATTSGSYTISATTPSSSVDTVLGLFSSTGQRLSYNDDISYPSNTDSRVTINLTAGTKYYIGITNYSSASRGAYTWTIDGPAGTTTTTDDAYENNDTFATANNLGTITASRTISSLVMADSADWFRFTTSATGTSSSTVSLSFLNSQGNLQLALYNSSGVQVASSLGTGNSESVSLNGLAAGTYYVDVFGASGATNPNYSLTINPPTTTTTPTSSGFQITLNMTGLTAAEQTIFQQAAARWSQVITGDLPNATYRGQTVDDLLIDASAPTIDGVGGVLGQSGPDAFRSGSDLPIHGVMEFDSADMASMVSSGLLYSVVLHEMGHILGIGTLWEDMGLLSGAGTSNPIFTGANATAQYNQIYGTSARGVPVEATGGSGTADSHWRETVFTNELMTGWAGPGTNLPLSRVTVGSLADLGYTVNYAAADAYTPSSSGLSAGRSASSSVLAASRSFGILAAETGISSSSATGFNSNLSPTNMQTRRSILPVSHITPIDQDIADYVMAAAARATASSQVASDSSLGSTSSEPTTTDTCATDQAWESLAADWDLWSASAEA